MPDLPTPPPAALADRLAAVPPLARGSHPSPVEGMCAMEAVAWLAGEPHSDQPECVCPVIGVFVRAWNDALSDVERDALLRPLLPRLIGTRSTPAVERRRGLMAADWLVRENAPAWLRLAGLTEEADALVALPEIKDVGQAPSIRPVIEAVRESAAAAWTDATGAGAAWAAWAAKSAVNEAAGAAARATARPLWVGIAVWDAARDAADAARDALNPTRLALQQAALRLLGRMIAAAEAR